MERLIRKGAEADIYEIEWFGMRAVRKVRKLKPYRHPSLDSEIRQARTLHEARILREAREAGVTTPSVYYLDPKEAEIVMQLVEGRRLREIFLGGLSEEGRKLASELGRCIAKLHLNDIIHGDLTTSNFIALNDGRIAFIDFGLSFSSKRLEDKAVDIHLLREVLNSAHAEHASKTFDHVMTGYGEVASKKFVAGLLSKVREIEGRVRYAPT